MKPAFDRDPLEELAEEFVTRCRNGERPDIDEFSERIPELKEEVRATFPALLLLENLASERDMAPSPAAASMPQENGQELKHLGDYRIIREIARGGMGIVYEAEQVSLNRRVALKVLPESMLLSPGRKRRFAREARAAGRLHHTNIVPVFGMGTESNLHYYVMQYIDGLSLDRVLGNAPANPMEARDQPQNHSHKTVVTQQPENGRQTSQIETVVCRLSDTLVVPGFTANDDLWHALISSDGIRWESVAEIGERVAEALHYSHAQGVLHRDIKPSNLLVDVHGKVWVTDFGLAQSVDDEPLTATDDTIGTLRYMAPERFNGQADARSDIYSLGLTLYEMLVMRPAFDESNPQQLIRQIVEGRPVPLRKLNPHLPRDLETVIHKAISPNPDHRYQSAQELAFDLMRLLTNEPIRARRVSIIERCWRWSRRNPGITWSTALSGLAILATVVFAFISINNERRKAVDIAADKSRLAATNARLMQEERAALQRERQAKQRVEQALANEARQKQEAERTAQESKAVSDFLVLDMIGATSPERSRGKEITVRAMLDRAAGRVGQRFAEHPDEEAAVRHAIGVAYHGLGQYDQSHEQWTIVLKLRRRVLGPEHLTTIQSMSNLASNHYSRGEYATGQQLEEEALEILRRVYGPDHEMTVNAMANLGANLHGGGKYTEARELLTAALEQKLKILGSDDPSTLTTMSNLAVNLQELRKYDEAETLYRRTISIKERVLGKEHPSTLLTAGNLADNLERQGKYEDSEQLTRRVLKVNRRVLGADHPQTLAAIHNLAGNLESQGRLAEAQELSEEVVAGFSRVLGEEHPNTLMANNNLAWTQLKRGESEAARIRYQKTLKVARRVLGPQHRITLTIAQNLALVLRAQQGEPSKVRTLKRTGENDQPVKDSAAIDKTD